MLIRMMNGTLTHNVLRITDVAGYFDMPKLMEMGQKLNQEMMNIVKKYNKF